MRLSLIDRLFLPVVMLSQRFRMRPKLLVVAAVMVVPLLAATFQLVNLGLREIEVTKSELHGAQAVEVVTSIIVLAQTQRGQTNLVLIG